MIISKDQIAAELALENFNIAGIIERAAEKDSGYFVYISVARDANGVQTPSNFKIKKVKENFSERNIVLDFIISDEIANNIEAGLRATLLVNHQEIVRNAFLSLNSRSASVWIDPKPNAQEHLKKLEETARNFLQGFNLNLDSIALTINENLPTALTILKTLRTCAPSSANDLAVRLGVNFTVPSEDWLRRKLDGLRKKELVVWLKAQTADQPHSYALSLKALKALGTERKGSSADITRLLAIVRTPT